MTTGSLFAESPVALILASSRARGGKVIPNGTGHLISCPVPTHGKGRGDRNPSVSVKPGDSTPWVIYCHAGCATGDIVAALGLTMSDLAPDRRPDYVPPRAPRKSGTSSATVTPLRTGGTLREPGDVREGTLPEVAPEPCTLDACARTRAKETEPTECLRRFTYTDATGTPLGQIHRWDRSDNGRPFRPFTPTGSGGWKVGGTWPEPYRLPECRDVIAQGGTVYITEGERDAESLRTLGHAATTNPYGGHMWKLEHLRHLIGPELVANPAACRARFVIVTDDDDTGTKRIGTIRETFTQLGLQLPDVLTPRRGKDVTEHLDNGGTFTVGDGPDDMQTSRPTSRLGRAFTLSDLDEMPPLRSLIRDWYNTPAACVLVGPWGLGKSALVLSQALSVATGMPFLGKDTKQTRVLYVVGEGVRGLRPRVRGWRQTWGHNGTPRHVPEDMFTMRTDLPHGLADAATWDELAHECYSEGYGFVVLDTLSSLAPLADETKDAARIMAGLNKVAEHAQATVVLVHHTGHSKEAQDRVRGGSQLEANADEVHVLGKAEPNGDVITVTRKKVKDGPSGHKHYLRRLTVPLLDNTGRPELDEYGEQRTTVTVEHARPDDVTLPIAARVVDYLSMCVPDGDTRARIAAAIEVPTTSLDKALQRLVQNGTVAKMGHGRYKLVPGADE